MDYKDYNFKMVTRFVSDYNLPISVVRDPDVFFYELHFFDFIYNCEKKWRWLVDIINTEYEGEPEYFIEAYSKARNDAIIYIEEKPEYKKFNEDVESLREWRKLVFPKSFYANVYNQDTIGRQFLAVDMKNANFQALKYAGVLDDKDYKAFLSRFAQGGLLEYMSESKYTRQVLFGKLNASRQITLEKKIMKEIYDAIEEKYKRKHFLAYFGADEFVLCLEDEIDESIRKEIQEYIDSIAKVDIRTELFTNKGWNFFTVHKDGTRHILGTFYHRSCDPEFKFKGMPSNYAKILIKSLTGEEINDYDKTVNFDKCIAVIQDDFQLEELPKVGKHHKPEENA